jgi:pimeloyl-ACP methyl ester carboxylesterase
MPVLRVFFLLVLLLVTTRGWASKPLPEWIATPDTMGLAYQSLTLHTPDHATLAAWLVAPTAGSTPQHTTLVLAGNDYGNMSYQLFQAKALSQAGYQVLLFDYRGFGHSSAFAIDRNQLYYQEFVTDVRTAVRAMRRRFPRERVGIIGYSMGTILASTVAASTRLDCLITDSYLGDLPALVTRQYATSQRVITLPPAAAHYAQIAPRVNCPWLLIAGTQDLQAPLADSTAVEHAARPRQHRQVLAVGCGHLGAMQVLTEQEYGDAYTRAITQFLATARH